MLEQCLPVRLWRNDKSEEAWIRSSVTGDPEYMISQCACRTHTHTQSWCCSWLYVLFRRMIIMLQARLCVYVCVCVCVCVLFRNMIMLFQTRMCVCVCVYLCCPEGWSCCSRPDCGQVSAQWHSSKRWEHPGVCLGQHTVGHITHRYIKHHTHTHTHNPTVHLALHTTTLLYTRH